MIPNSPGTESCLSQLLPLKSCMPAVPGLLCSTLRVPSVLQVDSSSPLPTVSSLLSLSSSGTLLSDPFLLEERELRCSLCSRPLLPGELCDWPISSWLCCDWLCVWEASVPWEIFGFGPDEVITGRGLLAWARVKWLCKNKSRLASDRGEKSGDLKRSCIVRNSLALGFLNRCHSSLCERPAVSQVSKHFLAPANSCGAFEK